MTQLSGNQKRQMRSAARLYAVQALFQMEHSGQTVDAVMHEFEDHRFGASYDEGEMVEGDVSLFESLMQDAVISRLVVEAHDQARDHVDAALADADQQAQDNLGELRNDDGTADLARLFELYGDGLILVRDTAPGEGVTVSEDRPGTYLGQTTGGRLPSGVAVAPPVFDLVLASGTAERATGTGGGIAFTANTYGLGGKAANSFNTDITIFQQNGQIPQGL